MEPYGPLIWVNRTNERTNEQTDSLLELAGFYPPAKSVYADISLPHVDKRRYLTDLPQSYRVYEVPFDLWNHLDYLWGIDAKTLLYPEVIKNMDEFQASIKIQN